MHMKAGSYRQLGTEAPFISTNIRVVSRNLSKILARQFYSPEAYAKGASFAKFCKPDIAYSLQFLNKMSPSLLDGFKSAGIPVVVRISDFGMICPQAHLFDGNAPCTRCIRGSLLNPIAVRCVRNSRAAGLIKATAMMLHRLLRCRDRIDAFVFPSRFTLERFEEAGFPARKLHWIPTPIDSIRCSHDNRNGHQHSLFRPAHPRERGARADRGVSRYSWRKDQTCNRRRSFEFGLRKGAARNRQRYRAEQVCSIRAAHTLYSSFPLRGRAVCMVRKHAERSPRNLRARQAGHRTEPRLFPEIIEHGKTGLLYKAGDVNSLKEALAWAMANPLEMAEMGRNARLLVETKYTRNGTIERLMETFSKVLP